MKLQNFYADNMTDVYMSLKNEVLDKSIRELLQIGFFSIGFRYNFDFCLKNYDQHYTSGNKKKDLPK